MYTLTVTKVLDRLPFLIVLRKAWAYSLQEAIDIEKNLPWVLCRCHDNKDAIHAMMSGNCEFTYEPMPPTQEELERIKDMKAIEEALAWVKTLSEEDQKKIELLMNNMQIGG